MTIDLICSRCGRPQAAHNLGSRCPTECERCAGTGDWTGWSGDDEHTQDGGCLECDGTGFPESPGFILLDSHALDDVPPALRALERARLAQEQHHRRMNVQLRFSSGGAS